MSKNLFMYFNQGLGDHIACSGAVKYMTEYYDRVHLLCWDLHIGNVKLLHQDNPKITFLVNPMISQNRGLFKRLRFWIRHFKKIQFDIRGFYWPNMGLWHQQIQKIGLDPNKNSWVEAFYAALGIEYNIRHTKWFYQRNYELEKNTFDYLKISPDEDYIFCCPRGLNLKIPSNKKIVTASKNFSIFDWIGVIEKASEIHTADTSWFHLIKQMRLNNIPKFYHKHPLRIIPCTNGLYLNDEFDYNWTIINY